NAGVRSAGARLEPFEDAGFLGRGREVKAGYFAVSLRDSERHREGLTDRGICGLGRQGQGWRLAPAMTSVAGGRRDTRLARAQRRAEQEQRDSSDRGEAASHAERNRQAIGNGQGP